MTKSSSFSINSVLYIIGKAPKYFHDQSENGIQRIESWFFNGGGIAKIDSSYLHKMNSPFDYSQKFSLQNKAPFALNSNFHFYRFEYRKDLKRFESATSIDQKIEIFERLVHAPLNIEYAFSKLVDMHIKDEIIANQLKKKRDYIVKNALRSKTPIKDWFRKIKHKFRKSVRSIPKKHP